MTAYSKTWGVDAANYYTATARALNKVETNGANILTRNRNGTWSTKVIGNGAGERNFTTIYTNTSNTYRFVCVSINYAATTVAGTATANTTGLFDDAGGTPATTAWNCTLTGATVAGSSVRQPQYFFIPPGGKYQINRTLVTGTGGSASAALVSWYEFDLDLTHIAQTWTTGEVISSLTKPNNYANDIQDVLDKDTATTYTDHGTASATLKTATEFCMVTVRDQTGTMSIQDAGGGNLNSSICSCVTVAGAYRHCAAFVNYNGASSWNSTPQLHFHCKIPRVSTSALAFTAGESGTGTKQKFIDLDDRASQGANISQGFTRTSGTTTGTKTAPTRLAFISYRGILTPTTAASSSITVQPDGTAGDVGACLEPDNLTSGGLTIETQIFLLLSPGQAYTIGSSLATGLNYFVWELNA